MNSWTIYIALFTSIASIVVAVVNAIINYKIIKSNNETSTKKMQLDYSIEKYKLINSEYNESMRHFINETCKYIQIKFLTNSSTTQNFVDFATAYFNFYTYCNLETKNSLIVFFNTLLFEEKNEDKNINKTMVKNYLRELRDIIEELESTNTINEIN